MKDNFLLKKSLIDVIKELSDEDTGKLFKGILNYVNHGDSELTDYLKIIFIPIKTEIDKNEERYLEVCEKNRLNGRRGGRPRKPRDEDLEEENPPVSDETEENPPVNEKSGGKPKKPINHNHIHNHPSNITNQNQLIKDIIDYLNIKTNSKFKDTTKSTRQKINARLNEGYTLDDFIDVINKKYDEWVGTDFEQYLCPETLFGTKFEKYLNQKATKSSGGKKKVDSQMEILKGIYYGQ